MKIDRLLAITTILMNKGSITAKELAQRFEVSQRTVYRDIDVLSAAGVPVYTNKGSGGGISLMEGYAFDRMFLSGQESESILIALQTLKAVKYPEIDQVLEKLGALFKNSSGTDWVEVDFSPWSSGAEEKDKFNLIRQGILKRFGLQFEYVGENGKKVLRNVNPIKLQFKARAWYLWAWCRYKKDYRTFRLTRIRNLKLLNDTFERTGELKENVGNPGMVIEKPNNSPMLWLKFRKKAEQRLYDDYYEELIKRNPDGTLEVVLNYPEDEWLYGYLMSFGPDVEVIEPVHIREILRERFKEAVKQYS